MKPTDPAPRRATALLLSLLVGACASSPPPRYHALQPVAPQQQAAARDRAAAAAAQQQQLAVGTVRIPPALDRAEVLREAAPGRFEVLDSDLWAAPLARLAAQTLAEDLVARLPAGAVVFPGASARPDAATLTVDILSFRIAGGNATMLLSWDLRRRAPAAPAPRGGQLQLQTPAADDGAAATARAFSELLAQLADRIAADRLP